MELIRIVFTDQDVRGFAEEHGVDGELAWDRAQSWARAIEDTATSLINEQLESVIVRDTP